MSKEETTTEYFDLTPSAEASFDLLFELAVNSPLSSEWAIAKLRAGYVRGVRSSLEG
tara:strand:+ start:1397 stop:1567 length:171 start_codon:yes stop_codon:yes gene_type:complete